MADNQENRLTNMEKAIKILQDTSLVQAQLEARLAKTAKELAENAERDRDRQAQHETRMKALDERIDKLVVAKGVLIARGMPAD